MNKYKKVTYEMKEQIRILRNKGISLVEIGKDLGIASSTVAYHSSEDYKKKTITRSIKNAKPRDRKDYNRKYQSEKYKNNEAYRERIKRDNRVNQKKKYEEKNGNSNIHKN